MVRFCTAGSVPMGRGSLFALVCLLLASVTGFPQQGEGLSEGSSVAQVTVEEMLAPERVWGGEEVQVTLVVRNRGPETKARLAWATGAASALLEGGGEDMELPAEGTSEFAFTVFAPEVKRRTLLICQSTLSFPGYEEKCSRELSVFPAWLPASLQGILSGWRVGVVEFGGTLTSLLEEADLPYQDVSTPSAVRNSTSNLILVAGSHEVAGDPSLQDELVLAARGGTRVVWFGEGREWVSSEDGRLRLQRPGEEQPLPSVSAGAITAPGHLVVGELLAGDLSRWRSTGCVGFGPPLPWPKRGNYRALAREEPSGEPLILETFVGEGSMTICQPPVLESLQTEPAAHLLFRGLLEAATSPLPELGPCALFAEVGGRWESFLRDLGIVAVRNRDSVDKGEMAILCADEEADGASTAQPAEMKALGKHLARGGKCLVLGACPEVVALLEALGLQTTTVASPDEAGPMHILADYQHPLLWGVLAADLASLSPGCGRILPGADATDCVELAEPQMVWKCSPPALAGTIIHAHFRVPAEPSAKDGAVLAQMLTNLGVLLEQRKGAEQ